MGLFLGVSVAHPQKKGTTQNPLTEVFSQLEKIHEVKFSYSDALVKDINLSIRVKDRSLDAILQEITSKTKLGFQKVSKRYIIVFDKSKKRESSVCGFLLDHISDEPLQEASITTANGLVGTTTDKKGYFQLEAISENDTIRVSFIGYKTKQFLAKNLLAKPCQKIYMEQYSAVLNEIFITNYLVNGVKKGKDGSVEILPENIGILPGLTEPDVLQTIQLLPGINSPNETASGIYIRGGTPDQNLVLFDGIKMYNTAHFFGMISAFNPYITEKIKVFRNGAGAQYGNHISGVIDIETNTNVPEKTNGGFGFNLTHSDAFVEAKVADNLGISFSVRRSFTDIINTNTFSKFSDKVFQNTIIDIDKQQSNDNNFTDENDFHFIDINSKIVYEPSSKDKIIINQLFLKNKLEHLFKSNDNTYSTKDVLDIKNNGISTRWIRKWSDRTSQKTSFYFSKYDLNYQFDATQTTANNDQTRIKQNQIEDVSFQTIVNFQKSASSAFNFGYQFTNNNVFYSFESVYEAFPQANVNLRENKGNNTHAIFSEYLFDRDEKQSFQLGLRSNYFSLTKKFFIAPRLYAQSILLPKFWIKGSLEYKQQNISQLLELSTADFGLENQVWALSTNDNIPVLRSRQSTLGFLFKKDSWTVDVDFYQKKILGVTSISNGFQTINEDFSEGSNEIKGIDILVQKRWNNYSSWVSYSFNDTKFTFTEINNGNSFAANTDVTHNILWSHSLKAGNYNFSLGWNLRSGIPYTRAIGLDTSNEIMYENINTSRLPAFHRMDFSTTYTFDLDSKKRWKGKVGLSLINIYNQRNVLQRTYSVEFDNSGTLFLAQKETFSLGFTPNMVFRVTF